MHIVICIKQVPDPEIAPSVFRVDEVAKKVISLAGTAPVINPFDEQAVEAALRIRDAEQDPANVTITAVTMGEATSEKIVRKAMALGVDQGVTLVDAAFADSDAYATARALAAAITKLGDIDLVLTGRQAADSDAGVVALGIAELLRLPAITLAKKIEVADGAVQVERAVSEGEETMAAPLPAVITIAHELGAVRKPSLRETMRAGRKPVRRWGPDDLGMDAESVGRAGSRRVVERLYQPTRDVDCEWVSGDEPAAIAKALVGRLVEQKLL